MGEKKKLNKKAKIITISCFSVVAVISIAIAIIFIKKIDIPFLNIYFNKQNEIKEVSFKDNISVNSEDEINIKSLFNNSELLSDNLEVSFENIDETLSDRILKTKKIFYNENKEEITENDYNTLENKENIAIKEIYYSIGKYKLIVKDIDNDKEFTTELTINDNTNPVLNLKEVSITDGESININSFIESCIDNSKKDCKLSFIDENNNEIESVDTFIGERDVKIQATDSSLNKTIQTTKLKVNEKSKTTASNTTKKNTNSNSKQSNNSSKTNISSIAGISQSDWEKGVPVTAGAIGKCQKNNLKLLNKSIGNPYILYDQGDNGIHVLEYNKIMEKWWDNSPYGWHTPMDANWAFLYLVFDWIDAARKAEGFQHTPGKSYSYIRTDSSNPMYYCESLVSNTVRGGSIDSIAYADIDSEYLLHKGYNSTDRYQAIAYAYYKENHKADIKILADWLKPYATCTKDCVIRLK